MERNIDNRRFRIRDGSQDHQHCRFLHCGHYFISLGNQSLIDCLGVLRGIDLDVLGGRDGEIEAIGFECECVPGINVGIRVDLHADLI